MDIVVDASVVAAWVLRDEDNHPKAHNVMEDISNYSVVVPRIFWYEICNTLLKGEKDNRVNCDVSDILIKKIRKLPFVTEKRQKESRIIKLGRQYNLTGYDAAYLVAAIDHNAMLATFDVRLSKATAKAGVKLFIK